MELTLGRQDILQVSTLNRGCMRLLPKSTKRGHGRQNVVVGDDTGSLLVFGVSAKKSSDIETVFKTPAAAKSAISRVVLAGEPGGDADRIFYSSGTLIRGSTRKGKEFLRFSTNVMEPIRSLAVEGDSIHTGGEFVYNEYISCKEAGFHMSNDKINEVVTAALSGAAKPDAILACQDRCLRVLNGGKLLFEVSVDGPATAVERYHPNPAVGAAADGQSGGRVIYGTEAGCVGEVHSEGGVLSLGWQINPALEGRRAKSAGVSCLHSEDITKDGVADIMVGREDGLVEVWSFDVGDTPKLAFERNLHESVTCIGCGAVSNSNFDEVVVSTYSGQIVAFSSEPGGVEVGAEVPAEGRKEASGKRVARLLAELDSLSAQVDKERAARRGGTAGRAATAAGTSDLKLRDKWTLCADEACYKLSLELAVPLEGVLLQCDVPVEMVETEAAGAIASLSPTPDGRPGLLVSFRCHEVTNRIELRMRTSEGRYGQLQAFVWPRISPKTCAVASYAIKPLSLHTRLAAPPPELPALSMLRIAGGFTVEQMHSWVAACLPEVPARLTGDTGSVAFRSTFLGTLLLCDYAKGEASFRSDSLTALSIVKEVVSKEATARKVHIQINVDARQETVPELLRKIDPLMQYQLSLNHKAKLIDSLNEVQMQDNDASFLAPEYRDILQQQDLIRRELREQPGRLQFLHGVVTDLYVDQNKFKGNSVAAKLPQLQHLLNNYSLDALLQFFDASR